MGLEYNKLLCTQTRFEQKLADGLGRYVVPGSVERYFLVRLDQCDWLTSPIIYDIFMQSKFNTKNLHLRILPTEMTPYAILQPAWLIEMSKDGVKNATFSTGQTIIPWNRVILVSFDGVQVRLINPVHASDVKNNQVIFKATNQIIQPDVN